MSKDNVPQHILVIGAGIAGPALALFLHKANCHPFSIRKFTCKVYEAYPKSEKIYLGGGIGLAPNGMAVLTSLGLDAKLKQRTTACTHSTFWTERGSEIARWNHGGFGEYMYGMMRSTLYDILAEELSEKGIAIEYQKKVVKVEERGSKVVVEFQDGSNAEGDYLIACDGSNHTKIRD